MPLIGSRPNLGFKPADLQLVDQDDINVSPPSCHAHTCHLDRSSTPSLTPNESISLLQTPSHSIPLFSANETENSYPLQDRSRPQTPVHSPHNRAYSHSIDGLSYVSEDGGYYHPRQSRAGKGSDLDRGLKEAEKLGGGESGVCLIQYNEGGSSSPPPLSPSYGNRKPKRSPFSKFLDLLEEPPKLTIEQQIQKRKDKIGRQNWPVLTWIFTLAMAGILIWELVSQNQAQGTPIAIRPSFNFMIGPSAGVMIHSGSRFVPCMKYVVELPPTTLLACLNDTSNPAKTACSLGSICGFGGITNEEIPNQWWRFVLPIFMHAGILHFFLNIFAQMTVAAPLEKLIGSFGFLCTYILGGVFGFVLGGQFARTGIPSVGASGSLFACNAVMVVDLILHWEYEDRPGVQALFLFIEFCVGIAVGYIPYAVDGLAHLGGYSIGLLCGIIFLPAILPTKRKKYIVWILRVMAGILILVAYVLSILNFYTKDPTKACSWCRYLSCFPTKANGHCSGTGLATPEVS